MQFKREKKTNKKKRKKPQELVWKFIEKLLATDTEVTNCFSIYYNSEIIELLTHLLLPTITILARDDQTAAVVAFS